jgi:hypothetical protein
MNIFNILASQWCESIDFIVQYISPHELFKFAIISKKNCLYVKTYLKRVREKYKDIKYGFFINNIDGVKMLDINLPHEKCLLSVWNNRDDYMDKQGYFFGTGCSYQFANKAIVRIVKIQRRSQESFKIYGWVLSGKCTYMMKGEEGEYFRQYPFWSYINISNYERFTIIPYK